MDFPALWTIKISRIEPDKQNSPGPAECKDQFRRLLMHGFTFDGGVLMSWKGEEARTCREGILLLLTLVLSACSNAPSVPVLGAYFPDWLFCILSAVLLAFLLHALLARSGFGAWLAPPALTYPVLTVLFALSTWLLFFQS
jgi:hypothetical protein